MSPLDVSNSSQPTVADREAELAALQSSFDEYIESSRLLEEELDAELAKVQKQLSDSNRTNYTLVSQLENLTPQLASLEKALAKANARLEQESELRRRAELDQDEAEAKARASEGTIDALKEESDKAFQELAFKEDELDELKIMLEVEKEKYQEEIQIVREELESMRQNIQSKSPSKSLYDHISSGLNGQAHEVYEVEKEKEKLEEKNEYIKSLEDELELVTEQLIESNDQSAQLMAQVTELQKMIQKTQPSQSIQDEDNLSVAASNGTSSVLDTDTVTDVATRNETIIQLQQDLEALTEEVSVLKKELELSQEELLFTQQELQAAELDLRESATTLESTLNEHKDQLSAFKTQLENAKVEVKSAKLEVDTITTSFLDSNHKNTVLTEELEALNKAFANIKSDNEGLLEENAFLKKSFDQAQADLAQKEERINQLKTQIECAELEMEHLNTTLANKELSIQSLEELGKNATEDDSMREKLAEANIKLSSVLMRLKQTEDEVENLKSQLKAKGNQTETSDKDDEKNSLKKHFKALQEQYNISTSRIKKLEEEVHRLESQLQHSSGTSTPTLFEVVTFDETKLLPDDLHKMDNEKLRLDKILEQRDFDSLAVEVRNLSKKSESQREHNAQLLTRILRLQGNIQVCCRVRPMRRSEYAAGLKLGVEALSETEVGCFDNRTQTWKSYAFDKVWGPNEGQMQVYQDVEPLALSVVDGYNSCIFAYGQTGSGKTYTMEGTSENHQFGVSYRVIQKIFNLLEFRSRQHNHHGSSSDSIESKFDFSIEVGMLEIYNEDIFDLLTTDSVSDRRKSQARKTSLDIRRGGNNIVEVPGLTKEKVTCIQDVMDLLSRGNANRATASTNLNEDSSRSHMVLNVRVISGIPSETQSVGNLFLVDLAGSERIRKSGVEGKEMKEAQHINKSLSALGNVMEALDRKASHIPYRNSKLTYLLQDALSGNSKTMMIVTVCPASDSFDETTTSLQFATRARRINLGVAQRNIRSKNLEETVKNLTSEMKVLAKAKKQKEEQLLELRKAHERIQDRLAKSQDSRNKMVEQESRTMVVLRKNNVDMVSRYQQEKASKEAKEVELEHSKEKVSFHQPRFVEMPLVKVKKVV